MYLEEKLVSMTQRHVSTTSPSPELKRIQWKLQHSASTSVWIFYSFFFLIVGVISCTDAIIHEPVFGKSIQKNVVYIYVYVFHAKNAKGHRVYFRFLLLWAMHPVLSLSTMNHCHWQTHLSAGRRLDKLPVDLLGFPANVVRWDRRLKVFTCEPELDVFLAELGPQEGAERR